MRLVWPDFTRQAYTPSAMQASLWPLMTYSLPSSTAVVVICVSTSPIS
jgi:hypothetical protein